MDKRPFYDRKNVARTDRSIMDLYQKYPCDFGSIRNGAGIPWQLKLTGIVPLFHGSVPLCCRVNGLKKYIYMFIVLWSYRVISYFIRLGDIGSSFWDEFSFTSLLQLTSWRRFAVHDFFHLNYNSRLFFYSIFSPLHLVSKIKWAVL